MTKKNYGKIALLSFVCFVLSIWWLTRPFAAFYAIIPLYLIKIFGLGFIVATVLYFSKRNASDMHGQNK